MHQCWTTENIAEDVLFDDSRTDDLSASFSISLSYFRQTEWADGAILTFPIVDSVH
jgi:hypothetical protein